MNNANNPASFPPPDGIPIPIDPATAGDQLTSGASTSIPIPLGPSIVNNQQGPTQVSDIPIPISYPAPFGSSPGYSGSSINESPSIPLKVVVTAENLCKYAPDGTVQLRDVSFKLFKGQLTCIMGSDEEGGCPLLRVLAFEETVTTGKLTILNQDISQLTPQERDKWRATQIAYIRQSHLELVEQTGHMLVAYWLHYFDDIKWSDAKDAARLALKSVGLPHKGDVRFRDLSVDEQARISIAKAYAHSNRNRCFYLLDDIFISLDRQAAVELVDLLKVVARRGKTVAVHANRQDIASHFDQVLEMRNEELVTIHSNP
jgi:ABC-type lipoprotein export system ATPase subunit